MVNKNLLRRNAARLKLSVPPKHRNVATFQTQGANTKTTEKNKRIRGFLAIASVIVLLLMVEHVFQTALGRSGSHYVLASKPYNELTKAAMDIRLEESTSMFQMTLAIMGALWGLLIIRKDEAVLVLKDRPELIMLISSFLLLTSSFICHLGYLSKLTDIYVSAGLVAGIKGKDASLTIADIFQLGVDYLFGAQRDFLLAGIFNATLTFVSAHKLK